MLTMGSTFTKFHYFKQVVNLSATCFHVELEQFLACFRVALVCQRQLGFLVFKRNSKAFYFAAAF